MVRVVLGGPVSGGASQSKVRRGIMAELASRRERLRLELQKLQIRPLPAALRGLWVDRQWRVASAQFVAAAAFVSPLLAATAAFSGPAPLALLEMPSAPLAAPFATSSPAARPAAAHTP